MDERPETKSESSDVGYCKPPEHSQFKKGHSGNPRGRPKGSLNIATVLERTLRERVVINENGRRKTTTKLAAALKQLANKAASGDLKALQILTTLARTAEEKAVSPSATINEVEEVDQKVLQGILSRLEIAAKEDD